MTDAIDLYVQQGGSLKLSYLHYEYMYPVKPEKLQQLAEKAKKVVFVENNGTGQFAKLIRMESGYTPDDLLLKNDGRPFFVTEIVAYIQQSEGKEA